MTSIDTVIRRRAANAGYGRNVQDALVGIAHHESSLDPHSLGDGGTSYGLFQLHRAGGALGNISHAQASRYFDPIQNIDFTLRALKGGKLVNNHMTTAQAVDAISRRFERPANPAGEIADALAFLRGGGASAGLPAAATTMPDVGLGDTATTPDPVLGFRQAAADRNSATFHLPKIKIPDVGSIALHAQVDPGISMLHVPTASATGSAIAEAAKHFLGIQYRWGGTSPTTGFDCSGLVQYVFNKFGVHIPRVAADQFNAGHKVSATQTRPGDLVFFSNAAQGVHHVGMVLGNGLFIQAPRTGDVVKISKLSDRGDIAGFRRFAR